MKKVIILMALGFTILLTNCNKTSGNANNASSTITALTNETFKTNVYNYPINPQWKYEGQLPAIIDFYATWCQPCKKLSPLLEDLAVKYKGKIIVYKVDVDAEQQLAQSMGISSMPTLLFIPANGQPQQSVGLVSTETLEKMIHEILLVK
ncbi:MAG: thioredoxin domain-containing protein [Bacteroidales bacterium]|nr:thioredoxin domain-containing protein [Bacteroidales bacterium]